MYYVNDDRSLTSVLEKPKKAKNILRIWGSEVRILSGAPSINEINNLQASNALFRMAELSRSWDVAGIW